jgi:hypothetical protein
MAISSPSRRTRWRGGVFQQEPFQKSSDPKFAVRERGAVQRQAGCRVPLRELLQEAQLEHPRPLRRQQLPPESLDQQAGLGSFFPAVSLRTLGIHRRPPRLTRDAAPHVERVVTSDDGQPRTERSSSKCTAKPLSVEQARPQLVNGRFAIGAAEHGSHGPLHRSEVLPVAVP